MSGWRVRRGQVTPGTGSQEEDSSEGLCFKEEQKPGGGWVRAWSHGRVSSGAEVIQRCSTFNAGRSGCELPGGSQFTGEGPLWQQGGARRPRVRGDPGREGGCPLLVAAFIVSFCVCSEMKMGVLEGGGLQGRVSEGSGEAVIEPLGGGGVDVLPECSGSKHRPEVGPLSHPSTIKGPHSRGSS